MDSGSTKDYSLDVSKYSNTGCLLLSKKRPMKVLKTKQKSKVIKLILHRPTSKETQMGQPPNKFRTSTFKYRKWFEPCKFL